MSNSFRLAKILSNCRSKHLLLISRLEYLPKNPIVGNLYYQLSVDDITPFVPSDDSASIGFKAKFYDRTNDNPEVTTTIFLKKDPESGAKSSCNCDAEAGEECSHVTALLASLASVLRPDLLPSNVEWKHWIAKASTPSKEIYHSAYASNEEYNLELYRREGEFIIRAREFRYMDSNSVSDIDTMLNRLIDGSRILAGKPGGLLLDFIASNKIPLLYNKRYLFLSNAREINPGLKWVNNNNLLSLQVDLPNKLFILPTQPRYFIDTTKDVDQYGLAIIKPSIKNVLDTIDTLAPLSPKDARDFSLELIRNNINIPLPDSRLKVIDKVITPEVTVSLGRSPGKKAKPTLKIDVVAHGDISDLAHIDENTVARQRIDDRIIDQVSSVLKPLGITSDDLRNGVNISPTSKPSNLIAIRESLEELATGNTGLRLNVRDNYPIQLHTFASNLEIETSLAADGNLMNFTPGIEFNGKRINLLIPILSLLDSMEPNTPFEHFLETIPDNIVLDIDETNALSISSSVIKPLLQFISDCSHSKTSIHLTRFEAGALFNLEKSLDGQLGRFYIDPKIQKSRQFFETLTNNSGIPPISLPNEFVGHLEPYQKQGADWLAFLANYGFGGVLADDMGAGKTRQIIAYLAYRKSLLPNNKKPKFLAICPVNPTQDWLEEIKRCCPTLDAYLLHGTSRAQTLADVESHDLIITTYGTFVNDEFLRTDIHWDTVILDEVQDTNNASTTIFKELLKLKADSIFASSGSPMENSLEEFRAVMDLCNRGYLGTPGQFNRVYALPIMCDANVEVLNMLRRKIGPFVMRRKDGDDGIDFKIPQNDIETQYFELAGEALNLYEKVRIAGNIDVLRRLKESGALKGSINTLPSLMEMRQICCDPRLSKSRSKTISYSNPKLDFLIDQLTEMTKKKKKALIFTYFSENMALISAALAQVGIQHVCIDGSDSRTARDRKKDEFRTNAKDHVVATLKAMNSGANLPQAHEVFLFDPWFNPHKEMQAIKRAHRKGLKHKLKTTKMIYKNTVEEGVVSIQSKKIAMFDAVLSCNINYLITHGVTKEDIEIIYRSPLANQ